MRVAISSKVILACLMLGFAFTGGACAQSGEYNHPLGGKKAPEAVLQDVEGRPQQLGSLIKDKKAVLFFWATWCPHCRTQIKDLNARKEEMAKENIILVLIDIGEPASKVASFMKSQGVDLPVFFDTEGIAAETYGVFGIPTMFFIGADGVVRNGYNGFPDNYKELLK
jgi:peroxiredoxin